MTQERSSAPGRDSADERTDGRSRRERGAGAGRDVEGGTETTGPLSWAILGGVVLSLVVFPAIVLGITEFGLAESLGLPRQVALGGLSMVPGVILGIVSILVMLTPD